MALLYKLLSISLATLAFVDAGEVLSASVPEYVIPDTYIVIMNDGISPEAFDAHANWVSEIHRTNTTRLDMGFDGSFDSTYNVDGMRGYSAQFDEAAVREIADSPDVAYIEPDMEVRLFQEVVQENAPSWGLGRISHEQAGNPDYVYDDSAGQGVTTYGVDSGIDVNHPDFEGRATWGANFIDSIDRDTHGHGTHTAGTICGASFGVAKKATIVAVKVLDGEGRGSISGIISGIDWSVNHAQQNSVISQSAMNLSLGGGQSRPLNQAASSAVQAGMFLAVAAGNAGSNAANYSPASEPSVCTVGMSNQRDSADRRSNWGPILDIYAPGVNIVSAAPGGGSQAMSGTSMASPHVCGLAAYFMALEGRSGGGVCDYLQQVAVPAMNPGPRSTNLLAYNNSGR